jgi:hypothetical protein
VLAAGGLGSSSVLGSAELYNPATGIWSATGGMAAARASHTATLLNDGTVLAAGGNEVGSSALPALLGSAELYDPAMGTWSATGDMAAARRVHKATLLNDGTVLVAGGYGFSGVLASAELYGGPPPTPRRL